jgi:hypothetical protein
MANPVETFSFQALPINVGLKNRASAAGALTEISGRAIP